MQTNFIYLFVVHLTIYHQLPEILIIAFRSTKSCSNQFGKTNLWLER